LDLQYGYFLTPGWEVGLRQALNYNFVDDGPDAWLATTTPFLLYNFHLNERIIPFLASPGTTERHGLLSPQAGVKIFLTDQTYLGSRCRYEWFFNSLKRAGDNADHGNHVGIIGFGLVWVGHARRRDSANWLQRKSLGTISKSAQEGVSQNGQHAPCVKPHEISARQPWRLNDARSGEPT
jgi:hypothetical protein